MEPDNFSDYRSKVIGFESTWQIGRTLNVKDKLTWTDPAPPTVDQGTATNSLKEIGIQTEALPTEIERCDDHQLAAWLRKIFPFVERELLKGPTKVASDVFADDYATASDLHYLELTAHQVISVQSCAADNCTEPRTGCAAWMSIAILNAPLLAVFDCAPHSSWCDHTDAEIHIFSPIRNQSSLGVHFEKLQVLPVMSCISSLCTNPLNKDMLAGGTYSGNIVVWQYERSNGTVKEHSTETSKFGKVVGLAWLRVQSSENEWTLLSAHVDGTIVCWKVMSTKTVQDKIFAIKSKQHKHSDLSRLSAITTLTGSEFVVGTEDGLVLLCSITSQTASAGPNNLWTDPVISELQPHQFAVRSLHLHRVQSHQDGRMVLVSCDVSGKLLIRSFSEEFSKHWDVIKMPNKLRNSVACTKDMRFLLTATDNGALEILSLNGRASVKTIPGQCIGQGDTVALSDNNSWVVIGSYNKGQFQLFSISLQKN